MPIECFIKRAEHYAVYRSESITIRIAESDSVLRIMAIYGKPIANSIVSSHRMIDNSDIYFIAPPSIIAKYGLAKKSTAANRYGVNDPDESEDCYREVIYVEGANIYRDSILWDSAGNAVGAKRVQADCFP